MNRHDDLTTDIEKKFHEKDRRKRKRMAVHGKQIFTLQEKMKKTAGERIQKLKKSHKK